MVYIWYLCTIEIICSVEMFHFLSARMVCLVFLCLGKSADWSILTGIVYRSIWEGCCIGLLCYLVLVMSTDTMLFCSHLCFNLVLLPALYFLLRICSCLDLHHVPLTLCRCFLLSYSRCSDNMDSYEPFCLSWIEMLPNIVDLSLDFRIYT